MLQLIDKTRLSRFLLGLNTTFLPILFHRSVLRVVAVYFLLILAGRAVSAIPSQTTIGVDCRDGYAIRLTEQDKHPGAYVRCEDFDLYQERVEANQEDLARMLVKEWRSGGDGN